MNRREFKYVDECDSIIGQVLRQAREQGADISDDALEFHDGKEVQADLHRWADVLDGLG